jgi:L-amino acid N-acyltransferase YncA
MQIISLFPAHWEAVQKIYQEGIATGNDTFQTSSPGWDQWIIGTREKIGQINGVWRDTVLLEKRSKKTGII